MLNTRALIVRRHRREDLVPARLRRLAVGARARRSVDAGGEPAERAAGDRADARAVRRSGSDRRRQRAAQAVARQRRADDLREPGRPPSSWCFKGQPESRADRQHDAHVGHQHDRRRDLRQRRGASTTCCSPAAGTRAGALQGPWTLSSPSNALPAVVRADPAGARRRASCSRRWPAPAGARGGDRELDSADRDRPARRTGRRSRRPTTARRSSRRSPARRSSTC